MDFWNQKYIPDDLISHNLMELVNKISNNLETSSDLIFSKNLLQFYQGNDWKDLVEYDSEQSYCRKVIYMEPNGKFELVLISWLPGQSTCIHNHAPQGCLYRVMEGEIVETRYDTDVRMNNTEKLKLNGVRYISDKIGFHQVENSSKNNSVSLHIYAPANFKCKCFSIS